MTFHSPAEIARRSHSIWSAVRAAVEIWYALLGGIAAWTIHILVLASFVQFTCNTHGYEWVMHLTTVVTLLMTGVAMALSWRLFGTPDDPGVPAEDNDASPLKFLGVLGLIIGAVNALLILLEELYVVVFHVVRCV